MNKTKPEITDIKVDGNTVRFVNVRKGKENEPSIVIESGEMEEEKEELIKFPTLAYREAYRKAFKLEK